MLTEVIDSVLSIDTSEQQRVVIKGMLQSLCLKYHVQTIDIDQLLNNNALFEHKCLQNINKLYKYSCKCYNQQQFKYILEAALVYITEGFTNNIPISPMTPKLVKKPSARKLLCLFTNILYVKKKTATRRVGASR